jgi:hypothetical protein
VIELDDSFDDINRLFVRKIQETKMKKTLKRMKIGKALLDDIPIKI